MDWENGSFILETAKYQLLQIAGRMAGWEFRKLYGKWSLPINNSSVFLDHIIYEHNINQVVRLWPQMRILSQMRKYKYKGNE